MGPARAARRELIQRRPIGGNTVGQADALGLGTIDVAAGQGELAGAALTY